MDDGKLCFFNFLGEKCCDSHGRFVPIAFTRAFLWAAFASALESIWKHKVMYSTQLVKYFQFIIFCKPHSDIRALLTVSLFSATLSVWKIKLVRRLILRSLISVSTWSRQIPPPQDQSKNYFLNWNSIPGQKLESDALPEANWLLVDGWRIYVYWRGSSFSPALHCSVCRYLLFRARPTVLKSRLYRHVSVALNDQFQFPVVLYRNRVKPYELDLYTCVSKQTWLQNARLLLLGSICSSPKGRTHFSPSHIISFVAEWASLLIMTSNMLD